MGNSQNKFSGEGQSLGGEGQTEVRKKSTQKTKQKHKVQQPSREERRQQILAVGYLYF